MRSTRRTVSSRRELPIGESVVVDGDGIGGGGPSGGDGPGSEFIDPGDLVGDVISGAGDGGDLAGNAGGKPKRGRKPRSAKANANVPIAGLAEILVLAHAVLSNMTGVEEFEIDGDEGTLLAEKTAAVLAHYPNVIVSAKTVDTISLFMALGHVYGPRAVAIRNNRRAARAAPARPTAPVGVRVADPASGTSGHVPDNFVPGFSGFHEQTGQ